MDSSQIIKVGGACAAIVIALGLIVYSFSGSDRVTSSDLRKVVESLPDDQLLQTRQTLASQIAEANRTRSGEKSEMLLGYEAMLADYDSILRNRGINPDELEVPSVAEIPMRKNERP